MIVDCGIHAREWASPAFCLYLIDQLLEGSYQDWTTKLQWVIYPMLNPDGYQHTWSTDRLWRKNMNPNNGSNCKGVDLNRNYDAEWMNAGSSQSKCSSVYAGSGPFSEPESQAHRDDMIKLSNKMAYLTYHAYSEFIIYPYSSSYQAEAQNKAELDMLALEMTNNIQAVHGKRYEYGEGAIAFYPASGGSDDWSHQIGIDLSFTIELRDTGTYGFLLPENQIIPNSEENIEGIKAIYDYITDQISYDCNGCSPLATCEYSQISSSISCVCFEGLTGDGIECTDPNAPTEPATTQPPIVTTTMPATTTTLPGPVTTEDPWSEAVCKGANKPDYFVTNESSKLIRQGDGTYLVRLLMGGVPETDPYTGLFVVSKKKCGKNFVEALNNRQIQLFMLDNYDSYELEHHYMSSGSHQNIVFQFRNDPTNCNNIDENLGGPKGCIGNPNRDVADVFVIGAKDVDMGNKKIRDCIEGIRVGYAGAEGEATLVNENIAPCVAWTQKFWG